MVDQRSCKLFSTYYLTGRKKSNINGENFSQVSIIVKGQKKTKDKNRLGDIKMEKITYLTHINKRLDRKINKR